MSTECVASPRVGHANSLSGRLKGALVNGPRAVYMGAHKFDELAIF
jgi:hypothetical protein